MYSSIKRQRLEFTTPRRDRATEGSKISQAKDDKDDYICTSLVSHKDFKPSFKDVCDILFPKIVAKNRGFVPRWLPWDYSAVSGWNNALGNVFPPTDGTLELTQVLNGEPRQIWCQYPHMSCMEWQILSAKILDQSSFNINGAEPARPQYPWYGNTVSATSWTDQRRQLAISEYKVTYEFTNLSNVEMYVELVNVAPKELVYEILAGSTAPSISTYSELNGSPLAMLCVDHGRHATIGNNRWPKNNYEVNFGFGSHLTTSIEGSHISYKGYKIEPYHRVFHERYSVCDSKMVKLQPGQKIVYDLVIPPFKHDSDFMTEIAKASISGTGNINIVPTFFKKSRFLMVRSWAEDSVDTVVGCMTPSDGRLGVKCTKSIKMRNMPNRIDTAVINTSVYNGDYDCDWAGQFSADMRINGTVKANQAIINEESDHPGTVLTA